MEQSKTSALSRAFAHFDRPLFFVAMSLTLIGLMTIYSSSYLKQMDVFWRQILFLGVGWIIAISISLLDYRVLERFAWPFYGLIVISLILVELMGKTAGGAQRWLQIGPIQFQPGEPTKLAVILMLARFYARDKGASPKGYGLRDLLKPILIVGVPVLLIFMQPNLGTTLLVFFTAFTIVFLCNLKWRTLWIVVVTGLISIPVAYKFLLKDYQRVRVKTFLNPQSDPLGEGYHTIQSMISTGSGQFAGKGFLQGSQSKLEFLPEHHTDFIFSVFAEEWGFLGSIVVLGLFVVFMLLCIDVVRKSKDAFGSVLAMGCLAMIMWQVVVNIGMELGVLPVVGVTLPFFSYGGSSVLTTMVATGILLSVSSRRHIF
jgi:rod shape determining protein RodA